MSDVAPPSFFPTPTEIAGGIRWMRAHPVVATAAAAAAATAVSVFTFLQTRADESEDELLLADGLVYAADERDERDDAGPLRRTRVRKRPAPLPQSAVDCHAPARKLSEEVCSSTDSDASSSPTRGCQSIFGELDADGAASLPLAKDASARAEPEDASASPHWGWYVSTTPPEDYYA